MIQNNFNLKHLNTMMVSVEAQHYFCLEKQEQLIELSSLPKPWFYLGGGSNVLFTDNYAGSIIHNCLKGIEVLEEDHESVLVCVHAGENWHEFVTYALDKEWFGLECLAYIPGTVGATPVQNIGAYGVEAKDYIEEVCVYNLQTQSFEYYKNDECRFAYRDSAFKAELKDRLVIHVNFRLSKQPIQYKRYYPALLEYLNQQNIESPTAKDIYDAVVAVRQSKLPEVGEVGSAGSFFKNPVVSKALFESLLVKFPSLLSYPYDDQKVKLPAGQLIDLLGFKGQYHDNVGMYEKQALILVNLGGATGQMLHQHSLKVMAEVESQFKICLEPEVIIL